MFIDKEDINLRVDLHMHSTTSDGSISINDLLNEIIEKTYCSLAISFSLPYYMLRC